MGSEVNDAVCAAYETRREIQVAFTSNLLGLCEKMLEAEGIEIAASESRTKSIESLKDKVNRPEKTDKYRSIEDVTDLSGVRIILFLKEDCNRAVEILSEHLEIDEENSTDKEILLDPDRFGYLSSHLIVSYTKERSKLIDFAPFKGMKGEIQIRTVLQHAWSAVDWRLRYKSNIEVPKQIRRRLYRISALLEAADDEFSSLDMQVSSLRQEYSEKIRRGDDDVDINGDSINAFLNEDKEWKKRLANIQEMGVIVSSVAGAHPKRTEFLLDLLKSANLEKIGQLRNLISNQAQKEEKAVLKIFNGYKENGGKQLSPEGIVRILVLLSDKTAGAKLLDATTFAEGLVAPVKLELEN